MIPYSRQEITEEDIAAVVAALRGDLLTTGPLVTEFEKALCAQTGAAHAVACASATAALHIACMAIGLKSGDLGVTSPITFLASANCIEYCGAHTDFIDIDPVTRCLSASALDQYCRTVRIPRVVIPVDLAGIVCDLEEINKLAKRYGFAVIQDAAHSIGSTYSFNGKVYQSGCGLHSEMTIFSFHPVKNITTGEGGAILTNSDELANRLRKLRSHGMTKIPGELSKNDGPWYYEMHEIGYHYRITDIQCALGVSQLMRLESHKQQRRILADRYSAAFANHPKIITPHVPAGQAPCLHLYPIEFCDGSSARASVYKALADRDIHAQVHYIPVHMQPYYRKKYGYANGHAPNAELFYSRALSLPLYTALKPAEQDQVIEIVLETLR